MNTPSPLPEEPEPPKTTGEKVGTAILWILVAIGVAGALAVVLFLGTCFLMAAK